MEYTSIDDYNPYSNLSVTRNFYTTSTIQAELTEDFHPDIEKPLFAVTNKINFETLCPLFFSVCTFKPANVINITYSHNHLPISYLTSNQSPEKEQFINMSLDQLMALASKVTCCIKHASDHKQSVSTTYEDNFFSSEAYRTFQEQHNKLKNYIDCALLLLSKKNSDV